MDIELRLRDLLTIQDPGVRVTEAVMARVGDGVPQGPLPGGIARLSDARARRRSRWILAVTLVAAAVAASMLVMRLAGDAGSSAGDVVDVSQPEGPLLESRPAERQEVATVAPRAMKQASVPVADGPAAAIATPLPRLLVKSLVHHSTDPEARQGAEAFRSAFVQVLGGMRDLAVLDEEAANPDADPKADFRVSITTLNTPDDPEPSGRPWRLEAKIEVLGGSTEYLAVTFDMDRDGSIPPGKGCSVNARAGGARPGARSPGPVNAGGMAAIQFLRRQCGAAEIAYAMGAIARPRATPVESADSALQLMVRMRDPSLGELARGNTLTQLMGVLRQSPTGTLDSATAGGIAEYIGALPADRRAQWWNIVGTANEPALIEPLLEALRRDPDEETRLNLVTVLTYTHLKEQQVAAALDMVAHQDSSEIVRMAAGRAAGDARWNEYVVRKLKDSSLSRVERMAPLLHAVQSITSASRKADVEAMMRDEANVLALVTLIREEHADPVLGEEPGRVLGAMNGVDHPALIDLELEILQSPSRDGSRSLAGEAARGLLRHRHDPRVREVLERARVSDADAGVRDTIERGLARPAEASR